MRFLKLFIIALLAYSCNGDEQNDPQPAPIPNPEIPIVTTQEITDISIKTAVSGGIITDDKGFLITEKGVCWDTMEPPTYENSPRTGDGEGASAANR